MRKKLLIFIIICLMLPFTGIVHASGLYTDSGISFLSSENGVILKKIPNIGEKIYAEVTVMIRLRKKLQLFICANMTATALKEFPLQKRVFLQAAM